MSTIIQTDQYLDGDRDNPGYRPDPLGQDTNFGRPSLGRPGKLTTPSIIYYCKLNPLFCHISYILQISKLAHLGISQIYQIQ